ncbi:MAG: response regulator [Acidobacteriota bacterium]
MVPTSGGITEEEAGRKGRPMRPPAASVSRRVEGEVLVVDDEASIRELLRSVLAANGYSVMLAASGADGVMRFAEDPRRVRLVVMDLMMPGISGAETLAMLKALDPSVKVLMMTGYSGSLEPAFHDPAVVGLILKPFSVPDLLERVQYAWTSSPDRMIPGV